MSETPSKIEPEHESYAFQVTRKLFFYTAIGTFLFSAVIVGLWYLM